ncbi:type II toxin-antitoxin system VapC family toxin [Leucobacter sp. Z1108]|uniref:type II toxin-antitoxin system VapC family toxin n=1 Tax=Leucobacter sp. Z1108 TaxID=3439066 RepID=UPI003F3F0CAE
MSFERITLDASVIIAHFNSRDAHHEAAGTLLASNQGAFIMHSLTLAEVLVAPARGRRLTAALQALSHLGIEEWRPEPGRAGNLAELRTETGLKMPDACVLDAALCTGTALATFDDRLAAGARSCGVRVVSPQAPDLE